MNHLVIQLGAAICQVIAGLAGAGQARCYDASSMQSLGYGLIACLTLVLIWGKVWSRTS